MFKKLIDDSPVTTHEVAAEFSVPAATVEHTLRAAGVEPIGHVGNLDLWAANPILRYVLGMDPGRAREAYFAPSEPTKAA